MSAGPAPAPRAPRLDGRRKRLGIGVVGFGWLGRAHSRSLARIPTLFAQRSFDPVLVACSDVGAGRRSGCRELVRLRPRLRGLARGGGGPRCRGRLRRRAQHAPRRGGAGSRGDGQAGVLREAGRRPARGRGGRCGGGARGRGDERRGLQLPLGAAGPVRARTDRLRGAGGDHQLPRALLLHVRRRPARRQLVALSSRGGRLRGDERSAQPRRRSRPYAAGADHAPDRHAWPPISPSGPSRPT